MQTNEGKHLITRSMFFGISLNALMILSNLSLAITVMYFMSSSLSDSFSWYRCSFNGRCINISAKRYESANIPYRKTL